MKRLIALVFAAAFVCVSLCSCMNTAAGKVKDEASEAIGNMQKSATTPYTGDNNGLLDDNRETVMPTENNSMMETIADAVATEWDHMVDDGEVEDGDGNVGEKENSDGDGNIAPEDEE